jgi:thiosulfate dehydrogenase [quinone] large subunit
MKISFEQSCLGLVRISLGWIFLWAFLDKVFGLGFATEAGKAWLDGVSPTTGYLQFATHGPLASVFQALANNVMVDWLFMLGLLLIGLSLMLGIGVRVAGYSGSLLLFLMFLAASLPPEHNPLLDEHIIYILVLLAFTRLPVGEWLGLGKWWSALPIVKKYPALR